MATIRGNGVLLPILIVLVTRIVMVAALSEFSCPETSSCMCSQVINDFEIQCPIADPHIIVRIQEGKQVQFDCTTMDDKQYALLPPMSIGQISTAQIRRCPLPIGTPIKAILDRIGVKGIKTLYFQSYGADLGTKLVREHLKGFEQLDRLALSGNALSDLPEDLFWDVSNLTWLNLEKNKVHLPRNIFANLEKLNFLELGNNYLYNLEEGIFRNQKNLKHLNLWTNRLQNLTKNSFQGVSSITKLDLSSNGIETFRPDVFGLLGNLTTLNLNGNNFTSLPEGLFENNKQLTQLRLLDNRVNLNTLPQGLFAHLPELREIRIKCNLNTLPSDLFSNSTKLSNVSFASNILEVLPQGLFADQINLLDLNLSRNKLTTIPNGIFKNATSLVVLRLSYNSIVNISQGAFEGLHNLRELYLDNNDIHRIDRDAFANSLLLRIVDLTNNQVYFSERDIALYEEHPIELGSPFQNLNELEYLKLRNNSITTVFRDWMYGNTRLREIDLSYNKISTINYSDLQFLSRDIQVNLKHNDITEINFREIEYIANGQDFDKLSSNVNVLLDDNPIDCGCVVIDFVKFLRNELNENVYKLLKVTPGNLRCATPQRLADRLVREVNPKELICLLDHELSSIKRCPKECTCWTRPADRALLFNCSNAGLTKVPPLPRPSVVSFEFSELYIENNHILKLPKAITPGFAEVREIYAKNNNISEIFDYNLPRNLTVLDVSKNHLRWLNTSVLNWFNRTNKLQKIALGYNPWICDCKTDKLLEFITINFRKISDLNDLHCSTGESLSSMRLSDICSETNSAIVIISVVMAFLGLLIGILAALYYKYNQEIKVWLFAHNLCLWFVTEKELDKGKKYDAFVSYSHKDEDFIMDHLVPQLEKGPLEFKLCLHIRDWVVGEYIVNQIAKSVEDSRRTIVLLSPNFLESVWARMEFRQAHSAALSERRTRVIVIIYGDIGDMQNLDPELRAYLNTNTYVKWGDPWFWEKLRYAMPYPSIAAQEKGLVKTSMKSSADDKLELIKPIPVTPPLTTPPAEQALKNPLLDRLNGEINQNGKIPNGLNGHVNGAFIINTNAKQSDV